MKHIAVEETTWNTLVEYLQAKPFSEVNGLMAELSKSKLVKLNEPEEQAEDVEEGE